MWIALKRAGEQVACCRVQRLMKAAGIQGAKRRGKPWRTTKPNPLAKRRPDLVEGNFKAQGPDRLWVADLTYLRYSERLVFFASVVDVFSRKVVGWQLAQDMRTALVLDAPKIAHGQRRPGADVAWSITQTAARNTPPIDYSQTLADHRALQWVGSVGDAYDNAMPSRSSTASRSS